MNSIQRWLAANPFRSIQINSEHCSIGMVWRVRIYNEKSAKFSADVLVSKGPMHLRLVAQAKR